MLLVNEINTLRTVKFEVLTALGVKITVFWYVTPCVFDC